MFAQLNRRNFLACSAQILSAGVTVPLLSTAAKAQVPTSWAAIAYSQQTRNVSWAWGHSSREGAEAAVVSGNSGPYAVSAISGSGCWMALAATGRGGWGASSRSTLGQAKYAAHEACRRATGDRGTIQACVFGGPGGVDFPITYDDAFTADQRKVLRRATQRMRFTMQLVAYRINEIATHYSYLDELVSRSFVLDYEPTSTRLWDLMPLQSYYLDDFPPPSLHFSAYHEVSDYRAKAPVGRVLIPYGTRGGNDTQGTFEVKVNRYWLGAAGNGSDDRVWAGVLVHELMHNLGHMHGPDEYGDHLQINAFQNLVRTGGDYKRGNRCPPFACDCRNLWR